MIIDKDVNTLAIFENLSRHMEREAARKISEILRQVYEEVAQIVTKKEFIELKEIIGDLAQAQKRPEDVNPGRGQNQHFSAGDSALSKNSHKSSPVRKCLL